MSCNCSSLASKWIVFSVWSAPMGVTEIEYKLPATVDLLTGVFFTVSENTRAFTQQRIGDVALLANDRITHPLNFSVESKSKYRRADKELLKLAEPIKAGTKIDGYYRNLTNIEHTVKIYLQYQERA